MEHKQIYAAFVKAQKGFAPALKNTKNEFFKSKYADLAACVAAVIDALNDNGIGLIQHCHDCDSGVSVETIFIHESGESLSCGKLHVPAAKNDPQGYGSALTYARRYSLMAACGIAPEDDDGNAASKPAPVKPKISAKQKADLIALAEEVGVDIPAFLTHFKLAKIDDLLAEEYPGVVKVFEKKRKQGENHE